MKEDVREASARPTLKWSAIVGRRRPKESLKVKVRIVFHLGSKADLNPSCRKETMNEEATIVHAKQPPSGFCAIITLPIQV